MDVSFPLKISIEGQSGFGKSSFSRVIEEIALFDWIERKVPHPIFHIDFKGNYLGFGQRTTNKKHLKILKKYLPKSEILEAFRKIELDFPKNIYTPAYAVPVEDYRAGEIIHSLREKHGITNIWRMDWRNILDLSWLANLFGLSTNTQWINALKPTFYESIVNREFTFKRLIEKGGLLESKINTIDNSAMRNAATRFLKMLRAQQYLFAEEDTFSDHLLDDFSYNVLTFKPVYTMKSENQWSFIIALQGIINRMQRIDKVTQPIFIFSDVQKPAGKGEISEKEASRAILEVFNGFGRSGSVGFIVVIEAHNYDEIARPLHPKPERYTHVIRLNPFISRMSNNQPRLIRGKGSFKDNLLNETYRSVYFRPPFSEYYG